MTDLTFAPCYPDPTPTELARNLLDGAGHPDSDVERLAAAIASRD